MAEQYEIIDNFLPEIVCQQLNDILFHPNGDSKIQFSYVADVNVSSKKNQFAFGRLLIDQSKPVVEGADQIILPIMAELCKRIKSGVTVYRGKVNLFTRTPENEGLGMHCDLNTPDYKTIIYYVNDNNGGTRLHDGTFIQQKKNRALIIHGKVLHETVTQTDANIRVNININYYLNN